MRNLYLVMKLLSLLAVVLFAFSKNHHGMVLFVGWAIYFGVEQLRVEADERHYKVKF